MKKISFIAFIIIAFSSTSYCQNKTLKNEADLRILSKRIAELFKNDSIIEVFTEIKKYWPLPENELTDMQTKSITMLNTVRDRFGESIGYSKVKEEKISDFALKETYLVRYTNHALRLIFIYYKNNAGWVINGFTWDDSFAEEFK